MLDLNADHLITKSDIIFVNETWLPEVMQNEGRYNIPGYNRCLLSVGFGKGIACFHTNSFTINAEVIRDNYQVLKISTQAVDIISVYRSAGDQNMLIDTSWAN